MNGQRHNGSPRVSRVAALYEQGRTWAAVIVDAAPKPTIVDAKTFDSSASSELEAWLKTHRAERLIRIAPIAQTLARCVPMPPSADPERAAALHLLAEAELPESVPPHRRAAGILPASGDGVSFALVTGWVARDEPGALQSRCPELWTTPIAALATLAGPGARAAILADDASGGIAVLAIGAKRAAARVLIESPDANWRSTIADALSEAQESVDAAPNDDVRLSAGMWMDPPPSLAARLGGASTDAKWMASFGLALGAALAAVGDDFTRVWTTLHAKEPRQRASLVEATTAWLSVSRNAWAAAVLGLVLLVASPLGIAYARNLILVDKARGVEEQRDKRDQLARDAALYSQLQQSRWPMSKLMADIAAATPVGVTLTSLRLAPDQGMSIEGSAESTELLNALQQSLNSTGLFRDLRIDRVESTGERADFVLSAGVVGPHTTVKPTEDYAERPLAVRLYGEGASNREYRESGDRASSDRGSSSRRPIGSSAPSTSRQAEPEPRAPRLSTPGEPPPPLDDETINTMERNTAMREWVTRNTFLRNNRTLEAAVQTRLEEEVSKLRARMDATR